VFLRTDVALLVTYAELVSRIRMLTDPTGVPVVDIDELLLGADAGADKRADSLPKDDDLALLQHSSGTTGLSKSVALSYRQTSDQIRAYAAAIKLDPSSIVVSWLPYYHDMDCSQAS
jgi:fatty-acyl-CoA synthase